MSARAGAAQWLGPAVVGGVALAVLLALTELVVRVVAPEPPPMLLTTLDARLAGTDRAPFSELIEPDPHAFWRLAPDVVRPDDDRVFPGRISNGQGLREEREIPHARPADELRILFLGASDTFGLKIGWDATLAQQLERRLAARLAPLRVECINAGVPGYSAFQGLQVLRHRGVAFAPDLVVASFGWNDDSAFSPWSDLETYERMVAARPPVLAASRLATLVWRVAHPLPPAAPDAPLRPRLSEDELVRVLGEMREVALGADADLLVHVSGTGWNLLPEYVPDARSPYQFAQMDFAHARTLRDGATSTYFDGVTPLQQMLHEVAPTAIFPDAFHPTALANERLAAALERHLARWIAWRLAERGARAAPEGG